MSLPLLDKQGSAIKKARQEPGSRTGENEETLRIGHCRRCFSEPSRHETSESDNRRRSITYRNSLLIQYVAKTKNQKKSNANPRNVRLMGVFSGPFLATH